MHRRSLYIAVIAAAALALLALPANSQVFRFGKWGQFWGTWVHQMQIGQGMNMTSLITLHVDGTVTGSPASMFGGLPDSVTRYSPVNGIWERSGWNSLSASSLFLVFDAKTGVVTGISRTRCSLTFSDDFNSYKGSEFVEMLACPTPTSCPNPADPTVKWTPRSNMPATGFSVSGTRVELPAAGSLK